MPGADRRTWELNDFVEAYEACRARSGQADPSQFVPERAHPLYRDVLRELVRVDLEYSWEQDRPRSLQSYQEEFPDLLQDLEGIASIAFEETRLRQQAQNRPSAGVEPATKPTQPPAPPGLDGSGSRWAAPASVANSWPASVLAAAGPGAQGAKLDMHDPELPRLVTTALTALPEAGARFAGFRLLAELGRGAFGRVYLAQQGDLANRCVALKISLDLFAESQTLAQLQHTNIVPIYSVHQAGLFHAVCMPYFGATTLADVLQKIRAQNEMPTTGSVIVETLRERRSNIAAACAATPTEERCTARMLERAGYVTAVLWLAVRLADGLVHAHERGILHRDLKPANILLTDEGQPMLLDFNLSTDTKQSLGLDAIHVGGTLPYMAPEHLEAFRGSPGALDARSDLYSLGVILFEMLAGRLPFALRQGPLPEVIPQMIADRRRALPPLRRWNRSVSPAVESIVRHCLAVEAGARYQTVADLRDDLQRQLDNLPLRHAADPSLVEHARKWVRRHPRLASPATLTGLLLVAAAAVTGVLLYRNRESKFDEQVLMVMREKQEAEARSAALKRRAEARSDAVNRLHEFQGKVGSCKQLDDLLALRQVYPDDPVLDGKFLNDDLKNCERALADYGVLDTADWRTGSDVTILSASEQVQLRTGVAELLYLLARATLVARPAPSLLQVREALRRQELALACFDERSVPRAFLLQRARLVELVDGKEAARAWIDRALVPAHPARDARDCFWTARYEAGNGQFQKAIRYLQQGIEDSPQDFNAWLQLAAVQENLGNYRQAIACHTTCIAWRPKFLSCLLHRAMAYNAARDWALAEADCSKVLSKRSDLPEFYIQRAHARLGLKSFDAALDDLGWVLKRRPSDTEAQILRAQILKDSGKPEEAKPPRNRE